jgi:hypothetical protein
MSLLSPLLISYHVSFCSLISVSISYFQTSAVLFSLSVLHLYFHLVSLFLVAWGFLPIYHVARLSFGILSFSTHFLSLYHAAVPRNTEFDQA